MNKLRKCSFYNYSTTESKCVQMFGYFHQFCNDDEDRGDNVVLHYTMALCEDECGQVCSVSPNKVQFVPYDFDRKEYDNHKMAFGW